MTIRRLLETGEPNHAALILADHAITYQELDDQIVQATEQLIQLGFRKGDRIGLAFPNGLEMIVSFLAASTVGTAAPLNPAYTRDEFKFYLEDMTARGLIVPRHGADEARAAAREISVPVIDCAIDEKVGDAAQGLDPARDRSVGERSLQFIEQAFRSGGVFQTHGSVLE